MRRAELLQRIRELGGMDSVDRAELVLKAVVDALQCDMSPEELSAVAAHLPNELREDWASQMGRPGGILEKEEMMFEPEVKA